MKILPTLMVVCYTTISSIAHSQCSSTSFQAGSNFGINNVLGSFGWNSLSNLANSDNVYSHAGTLLGILSTANSNYLVFNDFGFAIPPDAVICGIEVTREGHAQGLMIGSYIRDNEVRIIKGNTISGTNHARATNWAGADNSQVYGGIGDDWGEAWTSADINSSSFGVAISVRLGSGLASLFLSAQIDEIRVKVYYNLVLPVKLGSFTARQITDKVELNWNVASGSEPQDFVIQRSKNGIGWSNIDTVKAGTSLKTFFSWIDERPGPVNLYRLLLQAKNGEENFSDIATVNIDMNRIIRIYPNPSTQRIFISLDGSLRQVNLITRNGHRITLKPNSINGNLWQVPLQGVPAGHYIVQLKTNDNDMYTKLIVQ